MPHKTDDIEQRLVKISVAEEQKQNKERNLRRVRDKHRFDGVQRIRPIMKHGRNNPRGFTLERVTKLSDLEMYEDE